MEKVKQILKKYKDVILYLFFGACTTGVNVVSYWICAHTLNINVSLSTIVAWIFAVFFAYFTNRRWVFYSEASKCAQIVKEIISFFGCRLLTGILDLIIMYVFVDCLSCNDIIMKIVSNIIVIVLNYVASKMFIFRKQKESV